MATVRAIPLDRPDAETNVLARFRWSPPLGLLSVLERDPPCGLVDHHGGERGDLEILTFEAEQDYDELQKLYEQSRDTKPAPGAVTTLYLRSRTDGSIQPYTVWLPRDYTPSTRYPLVVQLHGLNFNKALAGQRTKFRGMRGADWIDPGLQAIVVQCFGRPSTFYQGMGEEDVLETMEEVQRVFHPAGHGHFL